MPKSKEWTEQSDVLRSRPALSSYDAKPRSAKRHQAVPNVEFGVRSLVPGGQGRPPLCLKQAKEGSVSKGECDAIGTANQSSAHMCEELVEPLFHSVDLPEVSFGNPKEF